jgi:hypothetical protein
MLKLYFRIVAPRCAPSPGLSACIGRYVQIFVKLPNGGFRLISSGHYKLRKNVGVTVYGQPVWSASAPRWRVPKTGQLAGQRTVVGFFEPMLYQNTAGTLASPRPQLGRGSSLPTRYRRLAA